MKFKKFSALVVFVVSLSGCISPKTYVDPSFSKANYNDIQPVSEKYETQIMVEFRASK